MEDVANEFANRAVVTKLDVDVAGKTAVKYGIEVLPTLIVFMNGKEVSRIKGAVGKQEIVDLLNAALSS